MSKDPRRLTPFLLILVAIALEAGGTVMQMSWILERMGISSVFSTLSIPNADRINFALILTLSTAFIVVLLWSGATILRGYMRRGAMTTVLGVIFGLLSPFLPAILGYPLSMLGLFSMSIALVVACVSAYTSYRIPSVGVEERAFLTPVEIAIMAVFSALTAMLTGWTGVMLPSPTGGYTHIGDTAIYVSALLFGSKVGGLVGIIGPVVADLFVGYPRWFVTVLAHGSQGFIAGLGRKRSIILQVVLLVLSGFVMATVYFVVNVYIKGYPVALVSYARDLFGQSLVSIALGMILTKAIEKALPGLLRRG